MAKNMTVAETLMTEKGRLQTMLVNIIKEAAGEPQADKPHQVVHGDVPRIIVPDTLTMREAANYVAKKADEMESVGKFSRLYETLPWAGAFALGKLLDRVYSATVIKEWIVETPMGKVKKESTVIDVPGVDGVQSVRWGRYDVAGLGVIETMMTPRTNRKEQDINFTAFTCVIHCKRMLQKKAEAFLDDLRDEIAKRELYAGAALVLQCDEEGKLQFDSPPAALVIERIHPNDVILADDLRDAVHAELFAPVSKAKLFAELGIPTRRGVLLAGRPGTGKTLSARCVSRLALDDDWSVFYLPDARGLEVALRVAAANSPAVLVCEDIDRQLSGERTPEIDRVLNALDGIDKTAKVVFVATSNAPESLPAPLLRPGRLDSLLIFEAPDAKAAAKLLLMYLGDRAPQELVNAGKACAGLLPASIREVAQRATLHAVSLRSTSVVTEADLVATADAVRKQQAMLEAAEKVKRELPTFAIELSQAANGGKPADKDVVYQGLAHIAQSA